VEWQDKRLNGTGRWYGEGDFVDPDADEVTDVLAQYCKEHKLGNPLARWYGAIVPCGRSVVWISLSCGSSGLICLLGSRLPLPYMRLTPVSLTNYLVRRDKSSSDIAGETQPWNDLVTSLGSRRSLKLLYWLLSC
jgi:hypothetical protein